jgi:hypothetical protein
MAEILQDNVIDVGGGGCGGGGDGGKGVSARSSTPVVTAGFAANAELEYGAGVRNGCGVTSGDKKQDTGGRGEEKGDERQTEFGGVSRGLPAGRTRLRGRLACGSLEQSRKQCQRQAYGNSGDHHTVDSCLETIDE